MANAGTVEIDFAAETAKFTAELKKFRADLNSLGTQVGKISKSFTSFGSAIKGALVSAGLLAGIREIIKATEESEAAVSQLEAALKSSSSVVRTSSEDFQAFAKQMQRTSVFTDEAVIGVETALLAFRSLSGGTIQNATKAVLDLSTRLGVDLQSAAKLVGRALEDPEKGMTALGRAGVIFSKSQQEIIKNLVATGDRIQAQGVILAELEKRYGGAAEAARNTLGGALKALSNTFGDLFEGDKNSFKGASKSINELTKTLNDPAIKEGFDNLITGLSKVIELSASAASFLAKFGTAEGKLFAKFLVPDSALSTVQVLEKELKKEQDLLEVMRIDRVKASDEEIADQLLFIDTLKQRIALAKELQTAEQRRAQIQALEPVKVTATKLEGPDSADTTRQLANALEQIKLRQQIVTADLTTTDNFLQQMEDRSKAIVAEQKKRHQFDIDVLNKQIEDDINLTLAGEQEKTRILEEEGRRRLANQTLLNKQRVDMEQSTLNAGIGFLQALSVRSKAAAKALILVNRGLQIAHAVQNTAAAVTNALANVPYPANLAAAAQMKALGAVQIGLIAATGALEFSNVNAGNAGGIGGSTLGTPANPLPVTPQSDQQTGATPKPAANITLIGWNERMLRDLTDELKKLWGDFDITLVRP